MVLRRSGGMPAPLSAMRTVTFRGPGSTSTKSMVPNRLWRNALESRLSSARRSCSSSTMQKAGASGMEGSSEKPARSISS